MSLQNQRSIWRRRVLQVAAGTLGRGPSSSAGVRRIAVIRPDHLGDLILALPAIARLRASLPAAEIVLFVGPWSEPLARLIPGVHVAVLPFPGFSRGNKGAPWEPYRLLAREARRIASEHYDLALILRFDHWWGAWLARLAGIPIRIGYNQPDTAPFLSQPVPYRAGRHESLQNQTLVDQVILAAGSDPPLESVSRPLLTIDGGPLPDDLTRPFAVFHPGSGALVKRWKVESFAHLARTLADEYGLRIAISGSSEESDLVESIAQQIDVPVTRLVGLTIGHLAFVLSQAALVVGPDSGILHLASAAGAPTVRLYGPVDHRTFGPWSDESSRVVVSTLHCVPCNRLDYRFEELPWHPCIRDIPVDSVIAAARQVIRPVALV